MAVQIERLRRVLPRGQGLPEDVWARRHRALLALLWAHAGAVPIYAAVRGYGLGHTLVESAVLPATALIATRARRRDVRTLATSVGLLSASAVLVHLSGGLIEMHFHFFVMVAVVALYQDWIPFLTAIGYVLVHHGIVGTLDPTSVFNHPAAIADPWRWAGIHALFIAGISIACLVTWRLNETALEERRDAEARLREESRVVETLNEIGKSLAGELDLQLVVQHVTDAATQLTNAQFGAFFYNVVRESGESYMLYTISGVDPEAFAGFPMPRNTPMFAPTFTGSAIVRIDDVTADPRYGKVGPHYGMPKGHLPVRSYLAVPVRSRAGEIIGGLFFGHADVARFGPVEERLATGIASHAAIAIDNARLYESERTARAAAQDARRRVEVMSEASRALSSSLEPSASLTELARVVVPAIGDSCEVYLLEADGSLKLEAFATSAGGDIGWEGPAYRPDVTNLDDPVVRALATHSEVVVDEYDGVIDRMLSDPRARAAAHKLGPTSTIAVPLLARDGESLGVLSLGTNAASDRRLRPSDAEFVVELGRRVAVAVENARLYALKRTAADTLQHSLLPDRLPEIPGLRFAARYVPGGPNVEVGGDWYDVFTLRNGTVGLVMGDVVGRGVTAASLMGQLRSALRAYAVEGESPGTILRRLNGMLYDVEALDNPMATVLYAVYDPDGGMLRIANAGHPPPLLVAGDGTASYPDVPAGVPIGAVPDPSFDELEIPLPADHALIMYTDGLVEDRAMILAEGLEGLRLAAADGPADLDGLVDHLLAHAPARAGGDDVAILAIRSIHIGARLTLRIPSRPSSLKPLRATLRRWLAEVGADEDETFEILVAVGEACGNAIQHAGASLESFELTADLDGAVQIEVRDRGRWRKQRPSPGGRGIEIIKQFMDEAVIEPSLAGTTVRMRRVLARDRHGVPG